MINVGYLMQCGLLKGHTPEKATMHSVSLVDWLKGATAGTATPFFERERPFFFRSFAGGLSSKKETPRMYDELNISINMDSDYDDDKPEEYIIVFIGGITGKERSILSKELSTKEAKVTLWATHCDEDILQDILFYPPCRQV